VTDGSSDNGWRTSTTSRLRTGPRIPGSLSLVLPAHNEEANLRVVVDRALVVLPTFTDDFEILIVDDGSRDRTPLIADELASNDGRVKAIHHGRNRGYGGALISGFSASRGDYVMFIDADRQFDIGDLALLAPFVGDFDIVAGFRKERHDALHRRIFAEIFNVTVRLLFGVHLRDIDCAFKVFRGDLLRSLDVSAPGALINTEIQAKARRQGATVEQVGVHHYPRIAGAATGGSARVIVRAMWDTVWLWWRMRGYRPPVDGHTVERPGNARDGMIAAVSGTGAAAVTTVAKRLPGRR
jgi:hypothetical protein